MSAFNLFGKLIQNFSTASSFQCFVEESMHFALVSLMVHLLDESLQVRNVCKITLEKIATILHLEKLTYNYYINSIRQ